MSLHLTQSKDSQYGVQAPHNSTPTFSETEIAASEPSPVYSSQHIPHGDQEESNTSAKGSQASIGDSPLDFAPYIMPESTGFDYDPTIYDFHSPTGFEWDFAKMWMPNFALDSWASTDLIDLNQQPDSV